MQNYGRRKKLNTENHKLCRFSVNENGKLSVLAFICTNTVNLSIQRLNKAHRRYFALTYKELRNYIKIVFHQKQKRNEKHKHTQTRARKKVHSS